MTKPTIEKRIEWIKKRVELDPNAEQYIAFQMREHANSKAEEMAIGFGKWLTNFGSIKSHLIENAFEEYKQSLK